MSKGPIGGVVWCKLSGRSWSNSLNPVPENDAQEMPALAPVVPTHTKLFFKEAAIVFGKSPGIVAGSPRRTRFVGSSWDICIILKVLEPGFTAKRY
jgi:hypothetical protein